MVSCTPSLDSEMPIGFMILWFYGFVHSISGHRDVDRFHGFVVSWFISPCTPSLDRFLGFMVLCTASLDSKMPIGFMVSWFHGFVHSISEQQYVDMFLGFRVSCNPSLDSEMVVGFLISTSCCPEMECMEK